VNGLPDGRQRRVGQTCLTNPPDDAGTAHTIPLGNVGQAHAAKPVGHDGLMVNVEGLTPDRQSFQLPSADIRILRAKHVVMKIWRNKSCLRKDNKHFTVASAEEQIRRMERQGMSPVGSLEVYACRFCGAYHFGHHMKTA